MATHDELKPGKIRLLCLKPGTYGSRLEGYLDTISLNTMTYEQGYEAVSYAWGERIFDHELYLDDVGEIEITRNLHDALQRLRPDTDHGYYRQLFVDAICIDQTNMAERSMQVSIMGRIFSSAFNVLVWLGESEAEDALAFATINLCSGQNAVTEQFPFAPGPDGLPTLNLQNFANMSRQQIDAELRSKPCCRCCNIPFTLPENTARDGLMAASKLLERSWFTRLWVVQEVVLSAEAYIISGSHRTEWTLFMEAISSAYRLYLMERSFETSELIGSVRDGRFESLVTQLQHFESFTLFEVVKSEVPRGARLLSGMLELSPRQCYDPRDRIYAIRSIHGAEDSGDFRPNYEIDLSTLYRAVSVRCLLDKTWRHVILPNVSLVLALAGTEDSAAMDLKKPS